ncbi:hypothetical protein [Oscillatoria salina]|uniref:hypothetical protein n=1 Tax=Oscillatoria salina TaxID=331517 RepID=UPI001CCF8EC5|nr:hypothetical protein [Oscillatoria salina]MBZ8180149.1 hypothetical protein [Oscillatoria salina IIICB1]
MTQPNIHSVAKKDLAKTEKYEDLIKIDQENPSWLKIVVTIIKELFAGKISEYLNLSPLLLSWNLKIRLVKQCDRCSDVEKQIFELLANYPTSVSMARLLATNHIPASDMSDGIQSLLRRALIEFNSQNNEIVFQPFPIVKEFILQKT